MFARDAERIAELGERVAVGISIQEILGGSMCPIHGFVMEPEAIPLHQQATLLQTTQVAAGGRRGGIGCAPLGLQFGEYRMGEQGILEPALSDPAIGDLDIGHEIENEALAVVETREVHSLGAGKLYPLCEFGLHPLENTLGNDPLTDVRFDGHSGETTEIVDIDPAALVDDALDRPVGSSGCRREPWVDVQNLSAPDRFGTTAFAQDESISGHEWNGAAEADPDVAGFSRGDGLRAEDAHCRRNLIRADVHRVGAASRDRMVECLEHHEFGIEAVGDEPAVLGDHGMSACDLGVVDTREIEGDPMARADAVDGSAECLDGTDPGAATGRGQDDVITDRQASMREGSGDDGAAALGGEDSVDEESWTLSIDRRRCSADEFSQGGEEFVAALTCRTGDADDGCPRPSTARETLFDLESRQLAFFVGAEIDLGESDDGPFDAQHMENA